LEMMGKISTSDLMSKYIPGVPADKSSITLHQLLTMSSGFPEAMGHDYDPVKREEFIQMAMDAPLEFAPGTAYLYSNVSYSILGAIVELVSGADYESFCRTHLWQPAGMYETGYVQPEWNSKALSVGYTRDGERWGTSLEHPWDIDGPFWHLKCNGGVLSTARDMYNWYRALKKNEILDANAKKKMYTPWVAEGEGAPSHYGYGWVIVTTQRGTTLITHNGGNGVFFADYLNFEDEDVFVFIQSNSSKEGMQDVAWELGRMINIPGYEPELRSYTLLPVTLQQAEQQCQCSTISALIDCIAGNGKLETFLQQNLGPGFLNAFPLEEHVAIFSDVRKELAEMSMTSILMAGEEVQLLYSDAQGKALRLNITLNEAGKIRGLRLGG
jgi:Beta-lactamase